MMTKPQPRRTSLRHRVVGWITLVVFLALLAVVVLTRSFTLGGVTDDANRAVEQEIEEFHQFASQGLDPATGEPFTSSEALIETYIARQIPVEEEMMLGFVDGRMLQLDYSYMSGDAPEPLAQDDPIVREILESPESSGVLGSTHWARISVGEDDSFAVLFDTGPGRNAVNANTAWISLISLGGLLAALFLAWIISGQITAPLNRLQRVASSISNSDLTQRVPVETNDEIGQLATTFNAMLDRIESAYRDQRQFVDDAGHELRTPITVVRGQLELLPHSTEEEKERSLALCTAELDRMARMVDDMLTLTVADSGAFVKPTNVDLSELTIGIDDKATTIDSRARLVDVAEGEAYLDPDRITQAMLELYGNALRYSDEAVELGSTIIGGDDDKRVRFWVRDRGHGIAADQHEHIFERFSRGSNLTSRQSGAGLGLSIVSAIAEAHDGRAYLDSAVGLGSIFGVDIPLKSTPAREGSDPEKEES